MTDLAQTFAQAYPKAIDFPEADYRARSAEFDAAAKAEGYRLAGFRLGFAVFSTKGLADA